MTLGSGVINIHIIEEDGRIMMVDGWNVCVIVSVGIMLIIHQEKVDPCIMRG